MNLSTEELALLGQIYHGSVDGINRARLRYLTNCYRDRIHSHELFQHNLSIDSYTNTFFDITNEDGKTKYKKFLINNDKVIKKDSYPYDLTLIKSSYCQNNTTVIALTRDGKIYQVNFIDINPFQLIPSNVPYIGLHPLDCINLPSKKIHPRYCDTLYGCLEAIDGSLYLLTNEWKIIPLKLQVLGFIHTSYCDSSFVLTYLDTEMKIRSSGLVFTFSWVLIHYNLVIIKLPPLKAIFQYFDQKKLIVWGQDGFLGLVKDGEYKPLDNFNKKGPFDEVIRIFGNILEGLIETKSVTGKYYNLTSSDSYK
ncbi:Hypothetical protein HVR_LOCUS801 [uncultured virus]|nr:Hypothetical protein HVR_LOCUS801 [uncultured virus]